MSDPDRTEGQTLEQLIAQYESGQPARSDEEQAEYDHLAACADEPEDPQAAGDWTPDTSRGLPAEREVGQ
jgi:hypothetical protein